MNLEPSSSALSSAVCLGAVVSLLFAPQSGEETRALIKDKSIELRDKASVSAEQALAKAEAAAAEARARADELAKELKARGESVVSDVRTRGGAIVEDVKTRGKNAVESIRKTKKTDEAAI
ncbi:MAG: YtxH domain-containing protein [Anaerolineales bacterium]|nr:YtxH domain-containing protein [Anaerolineales bacterium]